MYNYIGQFGMISREAVMALLAFVGAAASIILIYLSYNPSKNFIQNSDVTSDTFGNGGVGETFKNTLDEYST